MYDNKIKSIGDIQQIAQTIKSRGEKVVHCHGAFDIIHLGHIQNLLSAKSQGNVLVVTVTPDRYIARGSSKPLFNEDTRVRHLAALECVDYVALNDEDNAIKLINLVKPDVYVPEDLYFSGPDSNVSKQGDFSSLDAEQEAVVKLGGRVFQPKNSPIQTFLMELTTSIPQEAKFFLEGFKKEFSIEDIRNAISSLKDVRVLVIGDAILDAYSYCQQMDKAGKESLFTYRALGSEMHAGGVFAVANHLAGFVSNIHVITCVGDDYESFIKEKLKENVRPHLFVQRNSQTLVKRRYIENYKKSKIFEIYNVEGSELNDKIEGDVIQKLSNLLPSVDLVIVTDFAHGLITPKIMEFLTNSNKFLAVNAQINGGNMGYNFITKYKRADFVSLNEKELRFPLQERKSDIRTPIKRLSDMLNLKSLNITLGKYGCMYSHQGEYFPVPALTLDPTDTIGAGDAVLSVTSLLAYKNVNPKVIAFVGNCVGALAVKIVGNRSSVDPKDLERFISYLMNSH